MEGDRDYIVQGKPLFDPEAAVRGTVLTPDKLAAQHFVLDELVVTNATVLIERINPSTGRLFGS